MSATGIDHRRQISECIIAYLQARRQTDVVDRVAIVNAHINHPDRSVRRLGRRKALSILQWTHVRLVRLEAPYTIEATIDDCLERMSTDLEAWEILRDVFPD